MAGGCGLRKYHGVQHGPEGLREVGSEDFFHLLLQMPFRILEGGREGERREGGRERNEMREGNNGVLEVSLLHV